MSNLSIAYLSSWAGALCPTDIAHQGVHSTCTMSNTWILSMSLYVAGPSCMVCFCCIRFTLHSFSDSLPFSCCWAPGTHYSAAPERGMALLEGQYPMESAGAASTCGKHDPAVCEAEGWLVDECSTLQPRAHPKRRNRRQNSLSQEPWPLDSVVPEGWAGAAAQLSQGGRASLLLLQSITCTLVQ